MAFRNSGCSTARKGRFDDIKNTINCSLQAAWVNAGIAFALETYAYYQFVHFALRFIYLPWFLLQIVITVPVQFLSHHISYAQHAAEE
jgi:hypothetical protein